MRLRLHGVPEKNKHVSSSLCDQCADLLIAAERPALQFCDLQIKGFLQQTAGGTRRKEVTLHKPESIIERPFDQFILFVVMGD